jgi:hypothetical protein
MDSSVITIKSVRNKIFSQAQALIDNGVDVTVVISREDALLSQELNPDPKIKIIYLNKVSTNKYMGYLEDYVDLLRFISTLKNDDVFYARYAPQSMFIIPRNCTIITGGCGTIMLQ